jgi:hypothetical protein
MKAHYRIVLGAVAAVLLAAGTALPQPRPVPRPMPRPAPHPDFMPRPTPHPDFMPRSGITPGLTPHLEFTPRPNPVEVRVEVQNVLKTQPTQAIEILGGVRGQALSRTEQVTLARQAVNQLAVRVEAPADVRTVLDEVRVAGLRAQGIDPVVTRSLKSLEHVAERRVLTDGVKEVLALGEGGKWADAGARAREWLQHLPQPEPEAQAKAPEVQARAEVRDALNEAVRVAGRAEALGRLEQVLQAAKPREALQRVSVKDLPANLQDSVSGLRGLAELREAAVARWEKPPDVARIKQSAADFARGLAGMPEARIDLREVLQDLAVKAFLDGYPAEAKALLPTDGPAEHAVNLLRDLKALALGEGRVGTWPAERALTPEPGQGGDGTRGPPPGMRPLIPEGAREGWRPPLRESAKADLPPLEKAAQLEKALQANAEAGLKDARSDIEGQAQKAQQRLQTADSHIRQKEAEDKQRFTQIEEQLGRKLTASERAHVSHLAAQNKTDGDILVAVQGQADKNDEEQFLTEVAVLLEEELTDAERTLALQLRRQGWKVAEVADLLRKARARGVPPPPLPPDDDRD